MVIVKYLVLIVCLLQISNSRAEQTIRLTNGEWEPFLSEKLPHFGPSSQIVTEAFARLGITVRYDFFPWPRAYENARIGHWEGSVIWIKSEERAKYFYFSDPILSLPRYFYHLVDRKYEWSSIKDLKGLVIGVTYSYTYGPELDKALENGFVQASWSTSDLLNIKKLIARRIDLLTLEPHVLNSL
ncbi:substrate-binding periplasmic protein, partial [Zooshikella harenae]